LTLTVATGTAAATQVTLGSTTGTPSANIASCAAMIKCTFVPFTNVANPGLQVPFDGTVTSFSVNAGSAGGTVWLRVLRPAGGGKYTGVGTSPPQTLSIGVNTFTVSLAVRAGDLIGLDNDSSALMFDTSVLGPLTAYYVLPALADGATAAPTNTQTGYRLLLSATVQSSTGTGTGTGTTTTTTTTPPPPPPPRPTLTNVSQARRSWRAGNNLATFASAKKPPRGTTFRFTLNTAATVSLAFSQLLLGRKVNRNCVAQTGANRTRRACTRSVGRGSLSLNSTAGAHTLSFQGRVSRTTKLKPGTYTVTITAVNTVGQRVAKTLRSFTIVPG
jgi:hypothetical protein